MEQRKKLDIRRGFQLPRTREGNIEEFHYENSGSGEELRALGSDDELRNYEREHEADLEYTQDDYQRDVDGLEDVWSSELEAEVEDDVWNDDIISEPLLIKDEWGEYEYEKTSDTDPSELFYLGKKFNVAQELKDAVFLYSLKRQYNIGFYKSTTLALGAKCGVEGCEWRVYCSLEKRINKLVIKVYEDKHVCEKMSYTKMLKVPRIAMLFEECLRTVLKLSPKEMVGEIKRLYNFEVTEIQCEKAKKRIIGDRMKIHSEQFARLWDYQDELLRLIIGLDGAFLKWDIKGQLLSTVGRDAENKIYPIAWGIVDLENNWQWFINHLKVDLDIDEGKIITFISDKQNGLVNVVHKEVHDAEHRMCVRHILANWKKKNRDPQLEIMFWRVARSYTTGELELNLDDMKKYNHAAYTSLMHTRPDTWSRAYFRNESCSADNTNNLCESFNRTIKGARKKPLVDMLEAIRRQAIERITKRSIKAQRYKEKFTKVTKTELGKSREDGRDLIRYMNTNNEFEIDDHGTGYVVNINLKTCSCRKWELMGITCSHAMSVITGMHLNVDTYIAEYFYTQKWQDTYKHSLRPVNGMKLWSRSMRIPVLPPPLKKPPGRPKHYDRVKEPHETIT